MGNCASGAANAPPRQVANALRRLHESRSTAFDPDKDRRALNHLRSIWRAMLGPAPFSRERTLRARP